jgi:hypothetical protein
MCTLQQTVLSSLKEVMTGTLKVSGHKPVILHYRRWRVETLEQAGASSIVFPASAPRSGWLSTGTD